jgi:hypothetical protein
MAMSDVDAAGLSDQERAAMEDDTEDEASLKAIVGKAAPGDDAEDDAGADKGEEDAEAAEAKEGKDDEPEAAAKVQPEAKPEPEVKAEAKPEQPAVVFTATAPDDAADQIKALRGEKAAEFKKLMDGDITPEQYSEKEDQILGKIDAIQTEITTANVATKLTLENAQRSYLGKVNALLNSARDNEGIDYRAKENEALHGELDRTVKWLASDPANADKPEQWFLDEAHQMVKTRHGLGKSTAAAPAKPGTKAGKAPDVSGLPPTLRNMPAAADSEDGGEFSHLSTLSGMQLERALSKLSPEEQQRYLEA